MIILKINHQPSGGKAWVAKITGLCSKYNFKREFLVAYKKERSYSGKTGQNYYELKDGYFYEANIPWKGRQYYKVIDGKIVDINPEEIIEHFNKQSK